MAHSRHVSASEVWLHVTFSMAHLHCPTPIPRLMPTLMVYSHWLGPELGPGQGPGRMACMV